mmetsp:Transcript_6030/g.14882  ORF Transcript_6030/g.14882 Transcript_6030/m.14882 type:complete len:256 (+) Transcript_6030:1605-2372(+)
MPHIFEIHIDGNVPPPRLSDVAWMGQLHPHGVNKLQARIIDLHVVARLHFVLPVAVGHECRLFHRVETGHLEEVPRLVRFLPLFRGFRLGSVVFSHLQRRGLHRRGLLRCLPFAPLFGVLPRARRGLACAFETVLRERPNLALVRVHEGSQTHVAPDDAAPLQLARVKMRQGRRLHCHRALRIVPEVLADPIGECRLIGRVGTPGSRSVVPGPALRTLGGAAALGLPWQRWKRGRSRRRARSRPWYAAAACPCSW